LTSRPLWRQPLVAALPAGHPLAARAELEIGDLAGEPFVFFPRHLRATYFDQVMRWTSGAGYTPQVVQEAIEIPTLLSLVAAGVGVFLPIRFFERLSLPGVVYCPVRGAPVIEIVAVWRGGGEMGPVVGSFLEVAGEVLQNQGRE
ncbi:LysR family substrate-binding domain-containing protein, partial [Deinococcus sp. MIMF12]